MLLNQVLDPLPPLRDKEAALAGVRDRRDRLFRLNLLADAAYWLAALPATLLFLHWLPAFVNVDAGSFFLASLVWLAVVLGGRRRLFELLPVRRWYRLYSALGDERPPILYLRSFQQDLINNSTLTRGHENTFEERLARVLRDIGPVVAIGHPGETVPPNGAARLHFHSDRWQAEVRELMSAARLVVVNPGDSEGVLWEVASAMRHVEPERLLVFFSFQWDRKEAQYRRFREAITQRTGNILHSPLPRLIPYDTLFLYFDADWTPTIVTRWEFAVARLDFFPRLPSSVAFRRALSPVFERAGQDPRMRRAVVLRVAAITAVVVYLYLFPVLFSYLHPEVPGFENSTVFQATTRALLVVLSLYLLLFASSGLHRQDPRRGALLRYVEAMDVMRAFDVVLEKWRPAMATLYANQQMEPAVDDFTAASVPPEWRDRAEWRSRHPAARGFLQELDRLAREIVADGYADNPRVYEALGESYCLLVRRSYDLISYPRADASSPVYSNIVRLYGMWKNGPHTAAR